MRKNRGKNRIDQWIEKAAGILLVWLAAFFAGSGAGQVAQWRQVTAESGAAPAENGEPSAESESSSTESGAVSAENGEPSAESDAESSEETEKNYIRWVDFDVTKEAMLQAYEYDVNTHGTEHPLNWIELLAYLGAKYGGDFQKNYQAADLTETAELVAAGETTMEELTEGMKYYEYYLEAYGAVLGGMVGEYQMEISGDQEAETELDSEKDQEKAEQTELDSEQDQENAERMALDSGKDHKKAELDSEQDREETERTELDSEQEQAETDDPDEMGQSGEKNMVTCYGLKAFHPIAKGFPYSDYDDFGAARSYGYKREHLGHDMMGQVGTPIIAVESGYVSALGWNQYGGWRVGINSFDGKRYYYYAHLRQNFPYAGWLREGSVVEAGDVIGYMGRTGYSATENVNNIDTYHLHFGLQLIFDESQRDGPNQIWVSLYELVRFLYQNQCAVQRNDETKEWTRITQTRDPAVWEYLVSQ